MLSPSLLYCSPITDTTTNTNRCVVFMEPGRQRHSSLEDLVMSSSSLQDFYPNVPKAVAFQQLRKF
jgi:hypothetical protein